MLRVGKKMLRVVNSRSFKIRKFLFLRLIVLNSIASICPEAMPRQRRSHNRFLELSLNGRTLLFRAGRKVRKGRCDCSVLSVFSVAKNCHTKIHYGDTEDTGEFSHFSAQRQFSERPLILLCPSWRWSRSFPPMTTTSDTLNRKLKRD